MTVVRGNIRGYDDDRMVLLFSMMDGAREVPCAVSAAGMDELEHVPRTRADLRRSSSRGCGTGSRHARHANSKRGSSRALRPASSCAASISVPEAAVA